MNYVEAFSKVANSNYNNPAIVDNGGVDITSYGELDRVSSLVAGKLHALNCKEGDFVPILMEQGASYIEAYLGIMKAGCAVVPLILEYPKDRVEFIISDCEASIVIREDFFDDIEDYQPYEKSAADDSPALLIYTSGSTGNPKGIVHNVHGYYVATKRHQEMIFAEYDRPKYASFAPFSFIVNVTEIYGALISAATVYIVPNSIKSSVKLIAEFYKDNKVDLGFLPPQILRIIDEKDFKGKRIMTGSEAVSNIHFDSVDIFNCYGQSETCSLVTRFYIDKSYELTPIGSPWEGLVAHILDEDGNEVKPGDIGELCIEGDFGVSYFKNPTLSDKTFVRLKNGSTLIHTGDSVKQDSDGCIRFISRKDWMVKINGQRVEMPEIERNLNAIKQIANSAVKSFTDNNKQTYLAGYYELKAPILEEEIRTLLKKKMPDYMIPRYLIQVEKIPKNINGKIDRKQLPEPVMDVYKASYVPPVTGIQQALCEGFEQVLLCGKVGIEDDFIALGGDSIKVIKLIDAVKLDQLTADIILRGKTPKAIALLLEDESTSSIAHMTEVPKISAMTDSQRGVYFECLEDPKSPKYNIPAVVRLEENIDIQKYKGAIIEVAKRHPAFNLTMKIVDDIPSMVYADKDIVVDCCEVDDLDEMIADYVRPFDIENGPLYRFEICTSPKGSVFVFDVHHLIFDGTSLAIFVSQIEAVYNGLAINDESISIFDISEYEKNIKQSEQYARAAKFFEKKLAGCDVNVSIPKKSVLSDSEHVVGNIVRKSTGLIDDEKVQQFIKTNKITENTLFMGAFAYALCKFSGGEISNFATVNNGRHDVGLKDSIGMFVRTLPMHYEIDDTQSIRDFLEFVQNDFFETLSHDCISFGELVSKYGVNSNVTFVYQNEMLSIAEEIPTKDISSDIDVMLFKERNEYKLLIRYYRNLYPDELMDNLASAFYNIVSDMMTVSLLSEIKPVDDRASVFRLDINDTDYPIEYCAVHTIIEKYADQYPDRVAITAEGASLTYKEFNEKANSVACALIQMGIKAEDIIGIVLPRTQEAIIAQLAVWKASAAFLMMLPEYPDDRIEYCLKDAQSPIVITNKSIADSKELIGKNHNSCKIVLIEELLSENGIENPSIAVKPEQLAYCIYTSGSTGNPKGVMIEHRNLCNFVNANPKNKEVYDMVHQRTKMLAIASLSFDMSLMEIYTALCNGMTLCMATDNEIRNPILLAELIIHEKIDVMAATPSFMTSILDFEKMQEAVRYIKVIDFGAEAFPAVLFDKLNSLNRDIKIINGYGPTEATISCISTIINSNEYITIGRPAANVQVCIMDKFGRMMPKGTYGELVIVGDGVGRGYVNLPEKTMASFFEINKRRAYRTGDLCRINENNEVEIRGRIDNQVKLRGLRVELDEIEKVMLNIPSVQTVKVVVRNSGTEDYLAGFYVAAQKISPSDIKTEMKSKLPGYMIPSALMQLDIMPLTSNGKIDIKQLPEVSYTVENLVLPQTSRQQKIYDMVKSIIGHANFGIDSDLFDSGLVSLGTIRFTALLYDEFGVNVTISDIRQNSTVRKIDSFLDTVSIQREYAILNDYPITKTQIGVVIECMANPGTTIYNIPGLIKLGNEVDLDRLQDALKACINAHPYLKARLFTDENGNIRVRRNDEEAPFVEYVKGTLPRKEDLVRPFDLMNDSLYRVALYQTEDANYLFADFHHAIFDGTCETIFFKDLNRAYSGENIKTEQYTGYEAALDEEYALSKETYKEAKHYFEKLLGECDSDCAPIPSPELLEEGVGNITHMTAVSSDAVEEYCNQKNVSKNAFFNAVFGYVLAKYDNKSEVVYTTVYNGRNDARKVDSISMYVKTLPVLTRIDEDKDIGVYVQEVKDQLLETMSNDIYSFADISNAFGVRSDVLFVYQGDRFDFDTLCGQKCEIIEFEPQTAKSDILCQVFEENDEYAINVQYRTDLYDEPFITKLANCMGRVMNEFLNKEKLRQIEFISPGESAELSSLNGVPLDYDYTKNVIDLFEEQVRKNPDRIAVEYQNRAYTYREVDELSDRIGAYLEEHGVKESSIVPILIPRCEYMLIASLGVLKTGAAYQPLDSSYPVDRLKYMVKDTKAKFLIADEKLMSCLPDWEGDVLLLRDIPGLEKKEFVRASIRPGDLFVVLYTSGSTGVPKGCMLEHSNIAAFCHWYREYYELNENSRVLAYASYGFDANMMDMYPAMVTGAEVVIVAEDMRLNLPGINEYVKQKQITHMFMTTQVGRQFAQLCDSEYLKCLSVGGEALVPMEPNSRFKLYNGYGPTECTIFTTTFEVDKLYRRNPIGRPLNNIHLYVVDSNMRRLPIGMPGELLVAGPQVSRGYLNNPSKTAQSYISNPFEKIAGYERVYRTGDIVRILPDGCVDFIGRNDGQVKIRGFRIELPEVEQIIRRFPQIKDATVSTYATPTGGKELVAYVVSDEKVDINKLNAFIKSEKPSYMVPSVIMQIDRIPLNQNQKVNRKALPMPKINEDVQTVGSAKLTTCEEKILSVLKDTTGIEVRDLASGLIEQGLTSIAAISFVTGLSRELKVDIPVIEILKGCSVLDIENYIFNELIKGNISAPQKTEEGATPVLNEYPLTANQLGIYYESMQRPTDILYNVPFCFKLPKIDTKRLMDALKKAIAAHTYLNTFIKTTPEGLVQVRNDSYEASIDYVQIEDEAVEENFRNFVKPFNLHSGPLYRLLVAESKTSSYLMMDFHHIVFDGYSLNLFMTSLKEAYENGDTQKEDYTYFDYTLYEKDYEKSKMYAEDEKYFTSKLENFENVTEIHPDKHDSLDSGHSSCAKRYVKSSIVNECCNECKVTPSALFLASSFYTIARFAGSSDVYISTISNGRSNSKIRNTMGMFVHTLPVVMRRTDMTGSVADLIKKAASTLNEVIEHENYPFTTLASRYGYKTNIMYECQLGVVGELTFDNQPIVNVDVDTNAPKFNIKIVITQEGDEDCINIEYNDALYSEEYMNRLADALYLCTMRMMEGTDAKAAKMTLLDDNEARKVKNFGEPEGHDIPISLVHEMFVKAVKENPKKPAIIGSDAVLSYDELNVRSNILANNLIARGVKPRDSVLLLLPRRCCYFTALLGVLKAGASFIPCDPKYPEERIRQIIEDSEAKYIITTEDKLPYYPQNAAICIDEIVNGADDRLPISDVDSDDLAYMIYTSGSTGKPKGVMLRHAGVCNYFTTDERNILYDMADKCMVHKVLSITTVSFDLAMKDSLGMLCNGRTIVFADEDSMNDPVALTELIRTHKVDMFNATPSRLQQYMEYKPFLNALADLKMIVCGGEMYPLNLLKKLQSITTAKLINTYGPTEVTISSNMADLTLADYVSVGKPLLNYKEYIVDNDQNPVPVGIIGELLIGGWGVARGYKNLEEQTNERFIMYNGQRVYKTGDYAKWDNDGNVIIIGRKDNQVKLRGLRIELSEVENVLNREEYIKQSLVLIDRINGQDHLCAYFTATKQVDMKELRDSARKQLTQYMVPTAYCQLENMPMTPNGKIDRRALPKPVLLGSSDYVEASGEAERFFCDTFKKILKIDQVGANDNFFEIGGSSLTVTSVVVAAQTQGYSVSYSDVFKHATARELARLATGNLEEQTYSDEEIENFDYSKINKLLQNNNLDSFCKGEQRELGNILLTGANGYMGIHVLVNYLKNETGTAYCMLRQGRSGSPKDRLKNMIFYYFGGTVDKEVEERVIVLNGDVTQYDSFEAFEKYDINTVFNCAANVKHFSSGTDIEDVNIGGLKNCISFCQKKNIRLVHFSTTSVAGEIKVEKGREIPSLTEQSLYIGQTLDNKYTHSKFLAERELLTAIADGRIDAKIIRVGTLAPRKEDGEFQINYLTNNFMGRLRAYNLIGCFPYDLCNDLVRMGAIDVSADAYLRLARTPKECCVFNAANNHTVTLGDIIECMKHRGKNIDLVEMPEFEKRMVIAAQDPSKASIISSMIAYMKSEPNDNVRYVEIGVDYTNSILNRMDFFWNITDVSYIERFIDALDGLGFFEYKIR
ncbi:MAG: amino acid adenylation domain-containing protein [Lachnospiraceae bacterium]|nr:amino acid adenylation domain-containing protein [Candidatus Colinaster equi]